MLGMGAMFVTPGLFTNAFDNAYKSVSTNTGDDIESFDDCVYQIEYWEDKAAPGFSGGDGSKSKPFQISCAEDLAYWAKETDYEKQNFGAFQGMYFIITNDIVLNDGYFEEDGTYHDGGDGLLNVWKPIWARDSFIDGQNHTISGAYFVNESAKRVGVFSGYINELKWQCLY